MKEFIKYTKTIRLAKINKIGFLQIFLPMVMFSYLFAVYFNKGGISSNILVVFIYALIVTGPFNRNVNSNINLSTLYPIKTEKRVLYHFLYILLISILTIAFLIGFFLIISLIIHLVDPSKVTITDETPEFVFDKTVYFTAWATSLASYLFMLSFFRNDKRWWISFLLGSAGYFLINVLTVSVLNSKFQIIDVIPLISISGGKKVFFYIITGLLFITIPIFYFLSIYLTKPKRANN